MSGTLEELGDNPNFIKSLRSGAPLTGAQMADLVQRAYESGFQAGVDHATDRICSAYDLTERQTS